MTNDDNRDTSDNSDNCLRTTTTVTHRLTKPMSCYLP
jgi:hypothetical protein